MSNGELTAVFGVLSILATVAILFEVWVVYAKYTRKSTARADAFWKAVVDTHGRKSFDDIMRAVTADYRAGINDNQVLDLLVTKYKGVTIQKLESKNPYAGKYNPRARYNVQSNQINSYYAAHQNATREEADRKAQERDFADLTALDRLLAEDDARAAAVPSK